MIVVYEVRWNNQETIVAYSNKADAQEKAMELAERYQDDRYTVEEVEKGVIE